jgi:hypothetical protein
MKYAQVSRSLNFNHVRVLCYYLQRLVTQPFARSVVIHILRRVVGVRNFTERKTDTKLNRTLLTLHEDGIARLGQLFTDEKCAEILRYFKDKPLSHKSYPGGVFSAELRPESVRLGDYSILDLVHCPHVLALVNDVELIELAGSFLGCTPTISGISARWSFPAELSKEEVVVQQFHRDSEDWKALRIIVYLTDVTDDSGPHVYVTGTHLDRQGVRMKVVSDAEASGRFSSERIVKQTGKKGLGIAVDTAGLHKGEVPTGSPRLILSFQYSILPCFLYEYDPVTVEKFSYDPYINRLICELERS